MIWRRAERGEAEDFLQSTLLLTWKLCDDPANKSAVVNEKLVPELVGVMEATSLQDKSRSGAKEVLTHLMGDAVVNQGWLAGRCKSSMKTVTRWISTTISHPATWRSTRSLIPLFRK